jgi:two-component system, LytTR family, sensor kinase
MRFSVPRLRELTFWHYQITGWLMFLFLHILIVNVEKGLSFSLIAIVVTENIVGFLLTLILRLFYRKLRFEVTSILYTVALIASCSILLAFIWLYANLLIQILLLGFDEVKMNLYYKWIFQGIAYLAPIPFGWSTLYFGMGFWFAWEREKEKAEKANELAQRAQYQKLRYQLNPHFLFNALNSIRALIDENISDARMMITELSEFMRYSLICKNDTNTALRNEIEAVRHYLAIEKVRYEEKLVVNFDIDPATENQQVPCFLLFPLVENALKYGMQTSPIPLKVDVKSILVDGKIRITIINTGRWIDNASFNNETQTGSSIENVKNRLMSTFQDKSTFNFFENEGSVYTNIEIFQTI